MLISNEPRLNWYDGECLVINRASSREEPRLQKEGLALSLKVAKNLLERLMDDSTNSIAQLFWKLFSQMYQAARIIFPRSVLNFTTLVLNVTAPQFDPASVNLPMTRLSRRVLRSADFDSIVERRRANYDYLAKAAAELPGFVPLHPHLASDVCPWVFPAFSTQVKNLHKRLCKRGIAALS